MKLRRSISGVAILAGILAAILLAATLHGAPASRGSVNADAAAAFARLKALQGEWQAKSEPMGETRVSYKVIGGGSAVVERFLTTQHPDEEMVTVYHLDGGRLVLTHYCMVGNQPRMQASSYNPTSGELAFEFTGAGNLTPGAGHMHSAKFQFRDDDHFSSTWQFVESDKPKFTETAEYTRIR